MHWCAMAAGRASAATPTTAADTDARMQRVASGRECRVRRSLEPQRVPDGGHSGGLPQELLRQTVSDHRPSSGPCINRVRHGAPQRPLPSRHRPAVPSQPPRCSQRGSSARTPAEGTRQPEPSEKRQKSITGSMAARQARFQHGGQGEGAPVHSGGDAGRAVATEYVVVVLVSVARTAASCFVDALVTRNSPPPPPLAVHGRPRPGRPATPPQWTPRVDVSTAPVAVATSTAPPHRSALRIVCHTTPAVASGSGVWAGTGWAAAKKKKRRGG